MALVTAAGPIIHGVFQYGAFTAEDTLATAQVLAAFACGVPAYVLIKVLTPGFYARADTRTPVRLALAAMLVNLVGNLVLIWPLGPVGVGVATALSAWVNVGLLFGVLYKRGHIPARWAADRQDLAHRSGGGADGCGALVRRASG